MHALRRWLIAGCSILLLSRAQAPDAFTPTVAPPPLPAVTSVASDAASIDAERKKLDAERKHLAPRSWREQMPQFLRNAKQQLATEKVETVRRKAEVVQSKTVTLRTKQEVYESLTTILEQKIALLNGVKIPVQALEDEISRLMEQDAVIEKRLRTVESQFKKTTREIGALEEQIQINTALLGLKPEESRVLQETMRTQQDRLNALKGECTTIEDRRAMYQRLNVALEDSLQALVKRRTTRLRTILLERAPVALDRASVGLWCAGLALLLCGWYLLPLIRQRLQAHTETTSLLWSQLTALTLRAGMVALVVTAGCAAAGYGAMAAYLGTRALYSAAWLLGGAVLHMVFAHMARLLMVSWWRRSTDSLRTAIRILTTTSAWGLALYIALAILRIWGSGHESLDTIVQWFATPLTTVRGVDISLALFVRAGLVIWAFHTSARVVDNVLRTRIYPRTRLDEGVQYTLSVGVRYTIFAIGIITGLQVVGLDLSVFTVLAGTVGIGVGFGLQEIAKNFISGLVMLIERPVKVGDFIDIGGLPGRVQAIKARSTVVETGDNISVLVPNAEFMTQKVINWSYSNRTIRVTNTIGVAYGTDVELVKATLLNAAAHPLVLPTPVPVVRLESFGDSSMNFTLAVWTMHQEERGAIKSDINFAIERLFREAGIQIPFPQREVRVHKVND